MNIRLLCTDSLRFLLTEYLTSRGMVICENSDLVFVERGITAPKQGVIIEFSAEDLTMLKELLDVVPGRRESMQQVIGGWHEDKEVMKLVPHAQILYLEATGNSVHMVTAEQSLHVKLKLYELENALRAKGFIRISKSLIVNVVNIREIIPWFGSRYILRLVNNKELEVSRTYVKDFKRFLGL